MTRRRRATLILIAAIGAGLLAAVTVSGYSTSVQGSLGEMRTALVLTRGLVPGQFISPTLASESFERKQVPVRFLPTGVISDPRQILGLEVRSALPAGSYLTGSALRPPGSDKPERPKVGKGRHAVEVAVSGAGALGGSRIVDVLVTSDNDRGRGRTEVAARRVPLIASGKIGGSQVGPGLTEVTLGLTRSQAIRLVDAQSFARRITILPLGPGS